MLRYSGIESFILHRKYYDSTSLNPYSIEIGKFDTKHYIYVQYDYYYL